LGSPDYAGVTAKKNIEKKHQEKPSGKTILRVARRTMMKTANAYSADCPTRQILDRVGDKWAVLILLLVRDEPMRFNQLRRTIEGISQKMLSQVLKSLERDGLIRRRAIATVPVTVEYSITQLGVTLAGAVDPLRDWAEQNLKDVLAAQRRYDSQQKEEAA